jgi:hypothetical protein
MLYASTIHLRILKTLIICGNRPLIDIKQNLTYTQPYQKRITRPFICHLDLSLDLEGVTNEMPKMPV